MTELYRRDLEYYCKCKLLAGIDEAGRGALAGPVVIAAVCLDYDYQLDGLDDSKKLSPDKREQFYEQIINTAAAYKIIEVSAAYIDRHNILQATLHGFSRAYAALPAIPDLCLIDGRDKPKTLPESVIPVIKGDQLHACIAAASILAKVHRDRLMIKLDCKYPEYRFAQHKGYGTKLHCQMIHTFGLSPIHRTTFHVPI